MEKIILCDLKGKIIDKFNTQAEVAEYLGVNSIGHYIRNGYKFRKMYYILGRYAYYNKFKREVAKNKVSYCVFKRRISSKLTLFVYDLNEELDEVKEYCIYFQKPVKFKDVNTTYIDSLKDIYNQKIKFSNLEDAKNFVKQFKIQN